MNPRKILIVEDEMVVQLHLSRIVEELGHVVVGTAADRDEALEIAAVEKPTLVLMDIHLAAGTDGVETATQLVQQHDCAVVFISAYADEATVGRTEQLGAAGYLVKPFTQAQVRAAISTAFANHSRFQGEKRRSETLRGMLEHIGGSVFLVDAADRIAYANQSAAALVGWPVYRTYGKPLDEILGGGDALQLKAQMLAVRSGQAASNCFVEIRDFEGKAKQLRVRLENASQVNGDSGSLLITLEPAGAGGGAAAARREPRPFGQGTRLLVYSHDTFGLGHLRRCMALIRSVCSRNPEASVLLVTGSPMVHRYALPPGSDYVKLPALVKVEQEQYEARTLQISGDHIRSLRSSLILHTVRDYRPNVLLVDHSPSGSRGELLPALEWLKAEGGCQRILGLRDILDDPASVVEQWRKSGMYDLLEQNYDHLVVYGNQRYYDPVSRYMLPGSLAQKATFLNYVCTPGDSYDTLGARNDKPMVLVTIGGGDGGADTVIQPYLEMLRQKRDEVDFHSEILTGPFVAPELEQSLREQAEDLPVTLRSFVPSTADLVRRADVVISTAGYNTCTDLLSMAKAAILIPRVLYRQEQWIRASRFAELGLAACIHPTMVQPDSLFEAIQRARKEPMLQWARNKGLPIDGAERFAEFCAGLMVQAEVS